MNSLDYKRYFIKRNVMTFTEVSEYLNMNKQTIYNLIEKGEITPAKKTPKSILFSKDDIIRYHNKEYYSKIEQIKYYKHKIYGGSTLRSEDFFDANVKDYNAINKISIYFFDEDAIFDNHFCLTDEYVENELLSISTPNMVIEYKDGRESLWLYGLNCGYNGEGPSGSERVLKKIGIPNNLISEVYKNKKITYYKNNDKWCIIKGTEFEKIIGREGHGHIYIFNDNIVMLEDIYNVYNVKIDVDNSSLFIQKYMKFIPQPINVKILSKEYAINNGYCIDKKRIYQLIIQDSSGRELWINQNISDITKFNRDQSIKDILMSLGYTFQTKSFSQKISDWFSKKPFIDIMLNDD